MLSREWFAKYGVPDRIHSDQARDFEGKVVRALCNMYGVTKSRTTPYRPMANGQCERFNRTLHNLLRTLENEHKRKWPEYLQELIFAYNTTPHASTGLSPHYLLYGREARLPIDIYLNLPREEDEPVPWVSAHRQRLNSAYQIVQRRLKQAAEERKRRYDKSTAEAPLSIGTLVYVRNRGFRERHKIVDAYKPDVYRIVSKFDGKDVYEIMRTDGTRETKWVNRSELRRCPDQNIFRNAPPVEQGRDEIEVGQMDSDSEEELDQVLLVRQTQPHFVNRDEEEQVEAEKQPEELPRRTVRTTAGQHSNPFREPRSAVRHLHSLEMSDEIFV